MPHIPRFCARHLLVLFAAASLLSAQAPTAAHGEDFDLEQLALCIADSGAVFYGAHWCPACRKQREFFGSFAALLPYVECYDGSKSEGKTSECHHVGVRSFPTWHYPDGSIVTGAKNPKKLARATGCDGLTSRR